MNQRSGGIRTGTRERKNETTSDRIDEGQRGQLRRTEDFSPFAVHGQRKEGKVNSSRKSSPLERKRGE